jgi:transposase
MLSIRRKHERKAAHRRIQGWGGQASYGARPPGQRSRGTLWSKHPQPVHWTKPYGVPEEARKAVDSQVDEMRRLKAELKRVTEERDILKKAAVYFAKTSG